MSASACFNAACPTDFVNFTNYCTKVKNGGVKGVMAVSCLVQLDDDPQAVLDFLAGNLVNYVDLVLDPTGQTLTAASIDQLITLGLVGTFLKAARGSLNQGTVNTGLGHCGINEIKSTEWNYVVTSEAFDQTDNMEDLVQFNAYLNVYHKYHLFFVTCADESKAIHIPRGSVELTAIDLNVPESNKDLQFKQLGWTQTLAGAAIPTFLPFDAYNNLIVKDIF